MVQENAQIRKAARFAGVPLWKIAKYFGVSEPTITRWLRMPMSDERKADFLKAIENLSEEVSL